MTSPAYPISKLPRELLISIDEFQRYVVGQYMRRASEWGLARGLIQQLADDFLRISSPTKPAVDPIGTARLLGITVEFRRDQSDRVCGRLVPKVGGFQATVVGDPEKPRTRFTIGHECGHVLFYGPGPDIPQRIIPATPARSGESEREEWLCNEFSRALLMPSKWRDDVLSSSAHMSSVFRLANSLKVSPEVLLRRVVYDWREWRSSVFYCVRFIEKPCDVRVFRGADRAAPSESAPSSNRIRDFYDKEGRQELRRGLQEDCGVTDEDIVESPSTLWWRIKDDSPFNPLAIEGPSRQEVSRLLAPRTAQGPPAPAPADSGR